MKFNTSLLCLMQFSLLVCFFGTVSLGATSYTFHQKRISQNLSESSLLPSLLSRRSSPDFSNKTADEICHSKEFQPTMENWWLSGATEWLKEYTLRSHESERYQELGLIGSLASEYLKKTNFKCSIDTAHRCAVKCQDVVRKVPDVEDAKIVYFTLRSAQNIAEVTKIVHVSFLTTISRLSHQLIKNRKPLSPPR